MNGAKFTQKLAPGFKNPMRNLDNFRQAVESSKVETLWVTFVRKIHSKDKGFPLFYFQLLVLNVILETLSHFTRHSSSVFF